ncbi:DUF262 domain-containing protein [Flavobacterium psychrophilum]|uniref:DUF262 domain-containing protein n=1 Tax=Flavobacterium psychrophilum TaxID=96345 RepID=UPI0004F77886|nr:DUF262 domain-containing protein [Flavobacterium psychrophilum]AIN74106.1 hypothetical protein FPG3_07140 [Flavobacterium psychrophilum FPG3]EKT2068695.1 DUF262 domain-containing protein [Flavobacterium psychrophilum]EKT2070795.1 DUF262 domain-containing protein [Flavobacterium psychrophilum]EKT4490307.1 DUF262 domain-containing protein [Flavobacterium psychrophilum]MBF2045529.1 DUF262 domain-containing protein [Flavobacterium psychrophilum]
MNEINTEEELFQFENFQEAQDDYNENPPSDIVAYNELRSCADLLRMHSENQLEIQPEFQREVVWNKAMKTRLIDSLVKQLPIPSLCISLDYKTQERFVIDGLQRIATIIFFLDSEPKNEWKLAKLDDIDDRISGKSNLYIKKKFPDLFSKVQNTVLPITVLRCDYSKKNHMNYLFTIFHRLNSGGSKLTNQEIRNCIFNGTFNTFLKASVNYDNFKNLFEIDPDKIYRFSNEEFVLRFISFYKNHDNYNGSLSKFLNDFMENNKKADQTAIENFSTIFERTTNLIYNKIMNIGHLPRLSKATTEALFVGIAKNIDHLETETNAELNIRFNNLKNDELFSIDSLKEGLAQKERVINRLNKAILIFA